MSRQYFIKDESGTQAMEGAVIPLALGNTDDARVKIKGLPAEVIVAYIAEENGYHYIQPSQTEHAIFHNHCRINDSTWLKSGDWVQVADTALNWQVAGDQIYIHLVAAQQQPMPQSGQAGVPVKPSMPVADPVLPVSKPKILTARQTLLRRGSIALLTVLALMAMLVLVVTPVEIRLNPDSTDFSVSGFPPGIPFAGKLLFWPGSYSIHASKKGYRDLHQTFIVQGGDFQEFSFSLQPEPGKLAVTLSPQTPYTIYVDGKQVAVDGQGVVEIERGKRQLRIETERYLPINETIMIEGFGQAQSINRALTPAWAEVTINSQPPGATVRLNEKVLGVTPLQTEVVEGQKIFALSLSGYKTLLVEAAVSAGKAVNLLTNKLLPVDGRLAISSQPAGATITINEQFYATTPATLTLKSNTTLKLKLTKPGYKTLQKKVTLAPDEEKTLKLSLPEEYGTVFIRSEPADALLFVDGKASGAATQRLRLTTQRHTIAIKKPGFTTQQMTIVPRAGVSQTINMVLQTVAQTQKQNTPAQVITKAGQTLRLLRPKGTFKMGASRREAGRRANESQRLVKLTRPFYLGEKEVTNAEYRMFSARHSSGMSEGMGLNIDSLPVVRVSWDEAAKYCNWLSIKEGLPPAYEMKGGKMQVIRPLTIGYRLPSEAEWVYVARIHEQKEPARYPWSGTYPPKTVVGNFADVKISNILSDTVPGYDDGYRATAPVGSFTARPAGFYDLGGNVAEWTNDFYAVYPGQAEKLVIDPLGPELGEHKVVKDSSWRKGNITELRLSYRDYSRVGRSDLGFRIARYAE